MDNTKRHVSRASPAYRNHTAQRTVHESACGVEVWIITYEMEVVML